MRMTDQVSPIPSISKTSFLRKSPFLAFFMSSGTGAFKRIKPYNVNGINKIKFMKLISLASYNVS